MINLTRQVSINFFILFFFSGSHAKNVRNQLNFETLQFGLKDKTVRCTTFFSLAVHMRWAGLVSEMSLEKSDIATVVKRASHTSRYFQVRYNQRIWMFGNVFDRNIGWNSIHLSCFSGFFQPVKIVLQLDFVFTLLTKKIFRMKPRKFFILLFEPDRLPLIGPARRIWTAF